MSIKAEKSLDKGLRAIDAMKEAVQGRLSIDIQDITLSAKDKIMEIAV